MSTLVSSSTTLAKCQQISLREVDDGLSRRWEQLRQADSIYQSPFFSPCFAKAVADVRDDARVALFESNGHVAGILPYQTSNRRMLVPIGGSYNDLHGLLGSVELASRDFSNLLLGLGGSSFRFHAMIDNPSASILPHSFGVTKSFLADLGAHPEGYVNFLETSRQTIFKQRKKTRKMVKDLGPMRLEFDCQDPKVLDQVIQLKRSQYQRTYIFDLLSVPWAQRLLHILLERRENPCRGILSVLYAGDTLVAGHYGMLEGSLLHYWFPVYDFRYHQYSPGTALFLAISQEAQKIGVAKIDFGYGEQPYKVKLTDTITEVPYGQVDRSSIRWWGSRCASWLNEQRSLLPFKESLKPLIRRILPNLDGSQYR